MSNLSDTAHMVLAAGVILVNLGLLAGVYFAGYAAGYLARMSQESRSVGGAP